MKTNNYEKRELNFKRNVHIHNQVLELYRTTAETFDRISSMKGNSKELLKLDAVDNVFAVKEAAWAHLVWFFELLNNYDPFHRDTILAIAKKRGYKPYDGKGIQKQFAKACEKLDLLFQGKEEE